MKIGGKILIGMGLFLFGLIPIVIPISFIIAGVTAIIFDKEFKL